jgi:hypothetical protein
VRKRFIKVCLFTVLITSLSASEPLPLPGVTVHLRSGEKREWRTFPKAATGPSLSVSFDSHANATEYTVVIRQRDVKNTTWAVTLNGQRLGVLQDDERDMLRLLPVPANTLRNGQNTFAITGDPGPVSDDIEITEVRIEPAPARELLTEATIALKVTGEDGAMPVKVTIVDERGFLVPFVSLRAGAYEAQRTGVLYTPDGVARIGVRAGEYKLFASRGFEYSAPTERVRLQRGAVHQTHLRMRREVSIAGYISCDTHVHTRELSGHGDASVDERVLTAAGEGLDMVIATEHNKVADYMPALIRRHLDRWTWSIPGNEITTAWGHFNIFPTRPGTPQPDPREAKWDTLAKAVRNTERAQVFVQNHPRDLHSGYRPFDPAHYLSSVGVNRQNRPVWANAMEVVNSGAMSSDPMQLVHDWMNLLTRGIPIAAIGSSDTHTVDFVPIGQARTYISIKGLQRKWRDDVTEVARSLAEGRNLVSYGLAAELRSAGPSRPAGKLSRVPLKVLVYGPSWSAADHVFLYSNGQLVWEDSLAPNRKGGVKLRRTVTLTLPRQDAALVAVATGPGVLQPFWEVRKPYQPTSDVWTPMVIGISGALWIDGDSDGKRSAPLLYATRLIEDNPNDMRTLVRRLSDYDASIVLHSLELLRTRGVDVNGPQIRAAFTDAAASSKKAYELYLRELSATGKELSTPR